jgi:hypothetical protein
MRKWASIGAVALFVVLMIYLIGSKEVSYPDDQLRDIISSSVKTSFDRRFQATLTDQALDLSLAEKFLGVKNNPDFHVEILSKGGGSWFSGYWRVTARVSGRYLFSNINSWGGVERGILTFNYLVKAKVHDDQTISDIEELSDIDPEKIQDLGAVY